MKNDTQEHYCSFEVSQLLKEKGFAPEKSLKIFVREKRKGDKDYSILQFTGDYSNSHLVNCDISAKGWQENFHRPTHALAIRWIRDNFNLHISSTPNGSFDKWKFNIYGKYPNDVIITSDEVGYYPFYDSAEDSDSEALLYTLSNLI